MAQPRVRSLIPACVDCGGAKRVPTAQRCKPCADARNLPAGRTSEAARKRASCQPAIGNRWINASGYAFVRTENGRVREHRIIAGVADVPGDALHVHHINGIKDDNRLENLEALTPEEHAQRHNNDAPWAMRRRASVADFARSAAGRENRRRAGSLGGGSNRNPVSVDAVLILQADGLTLDQMAKLLGVGVKVIRNRLREAHGLPAIGKRVPA